MHLKHFGDSYDIVKKSLLVWLSGFGPWAAHPMFTHTVSKYEAQAFSKFLAVPLVSTAVLNTTTDRKAYFAPLAGWKRVFLDPDTGVRLGRQFGRRSSEFLFAEDLVALVADRTAGLVLSFDQSLPRGSERAAVSAKLAAMAELGVHGFAYVSHASFLVVGSSADVVRGARTSLLATSALPPDRLVSGPGL